MKLPSQLRDWAKGTKEVDLESVPDLLSALKKLDAAYPGIGQRILDDQDRIREHINVFVNSENSRSLSEEKTKLKGGDVIYILPSVAGG